MNKIQSWDLFDTLIGRKCGTPVRLWEEMGVWLDDPHFVERRIVAEERAKLIATKVGREYSLRDIYVSMEHPFMLAKDGIEMEFRHELDNVFPIRRYADQLMEDDIIVSDMYLSEEQLRALLEAAGIHFGGKIYVSNKGKLDGSMWKRIARDHLVAVHTGDHSISDVKMPMRYRIPASLVRTGLNPPEKFYESHVPGMGWWLRANRLELLRDDRHIDKLNFLQLEFNLPFLWACCHLLAEFAQREGVRKLLFMSRDTFLMHNLFINLYPEFESDYIWISRECLRTGSDSFMAYLNSLLTEDAALVDIAASCGSLKAALPKLKVSSPRIWTAVFLREPFRVEVEPIRCEYVVKNNEFRINNTYMEMLNYATHWHVHDIVGFDPIFDLQDEYDMGLVEGYHNIFRQALDTLPLLKFNDLEDVRVIFEYALGAIQKEGKFLQQVFPKHLLIERTRKRSLV